MASDTSTQGTLATTDPPALVSETAYTCFCACVPKALVTIAMVRPALAKIETRATDMKKTASRLYLRGSGCSSLPVAFATPSSSSLTSTLGGALLLLSFSGSTSVICRSSHRARGSVSIRAQVSIRASAVTGCRAGLKGLGWGLARHTRSHQTTRRAEGRVEAGGWTREAGRRA
eukprot:scaffold25520_cov60-Phaeocystis_antarctica.AAC.5